MNMSIEVLVGSVIDVGKPLGKEGVNNGPCAAADVSECRGWWSSEAD